jgi:hypothetical protein
METLSNKIAKINEAYDQKQRETLEKLAEERAMAIAKATVDDTIENLGSMAMGNIISIFENVSSEVLKTKGGKAKINGFLSLVKEDKNIHNSYLLKENVFSVNGIEDPKEYINESIAIANETNNAKGFKDSKKKLAGFVSEAIKSVNPMKIYEKVVIDDQVKKINENLETLMWGKRSVQKTAERTKCINETVDFMMKKDEIPTESKEEVFEHYKNECINSLNEAWENADASVRIKLTEVKDRISKKSYSELTVDDDIKYMKELIDTVK